MEILKTSPRASAPPRTVVPYRFPSVAWINAPSGSQPSELTKVCSNVYVPDKVILKTVPKSAPGPPAVVPKRAPPLWTSPA